MLYSNLGGILGDVGAFGAGVSKNAEQPTNFKVVYNSDKNITLNWRNNGAKILTIQSSIDGGVTWTTIATSPTNFKETDETYTLDLLSNADRIFRLGYTGSTNYVKYFVALEMFLFAFGKKATVILNKDVKDVEVQGCVSLTDTTTISRISSSSIVGSNKVYVVNIPDNTKAALKAYNTKTNEILKVVEYAARDDYLTTTSAKGDIKQADIGGGSARIEFVADLKMPASFGTGNQTLFEMGNSTKGLHLYIYGGNLGFSVGTSNTRDDKAENAFEVSKRYIIKLIFDGYSFEAKTLCIDDDETVFTSKFKFSYTGEYTNISWGGFGMRGGTYFHGPDGVNFTGTIYYFTVLNFIIPDEQSIKLTDAIKSTIPVPSDILARAVAGDGTATYSSDFWTAFGGKTYDIKIIKSLTDYQIRFFYGDSRDVNKSDTRLHKVSGWYSFADLRKSAGITDSFYFLPLETNKMPYVIFVKMDSEGRIKFQGQRPLTDIIANSFVNSGFVAIHDIQIRKTP